MRAMEGKFPDITQCNTVIGQGIQVWGVLIARTMSSPE
jgi:hypothetical protein